MNKKGIAFNYTIAGIIAVIVLIILIWIFRDTVSAALEPLFNIIRGVNNTSGDIGAEISNLV